MDTTKRVAAAVALLLLVGSIFFLIHWVGSPRYELLYARLTEQDRSEIIAKLEEMGVPYRASAVGGLEVPNALSVRANLLKAGIPHGGVVGWEIFDQNSFSATDFTNQINRQRAIAGELSRTLQQVAGILDAKVLLNIPDSGEYLFAEDKPEGTASVQLQLRSPGVLTSDQVGAIANLVATSTGLKRENITIIDNFANDLTAMLRPDRNNGRKMGVGQVVDTFTIKSDYETVVEKRVESMLSKVFGFNKAVVRVSADLDLDYQELKSETYADKGVPRSEQERSESSQGVGAGPDAGVPGTDSNLPRYQIVETEQTRYNSEKTERTVNYEINKVEEFRIATPGKVKRLSVGVWVDGNLPETVREKVTNTVAAAVGIIPERGDQLTVETINFTQPQPTAELPPQTAFTVWLIAIAGIIVGGLIAFLLLRRRQKAEAPEPAPEELPVMGTTIDAMVAEDLQPELASTLEVSLEEKTRQGRQAELERYARENPEDVAVLLKTWLSEDN